MNKKKNVYYAFFAIAVVCAAATIIIAYMLVKDSLETNKGRDYYAALSSVAESEPPTATPRPTPTPVPTVPGESAAPTPEPVEEDATEESIGFVEVIVEEEEPQPVFVPTMNFERISQTYPGVVGWIRLEDTIINYPIMHGEDNDYFLHHLPDGTPHKMGSIFIDFRCKPDFSGRNTVIYGHHLKTGDMFTVFEQYKKGGQKYYEEHPVVMLYTPEANYMLMLFAGYVVEGAAPYLSIDFRDNDDIFTRYLGELRKRSVFKSEVEVGARDKIVSMVTCTYDFDNARFILVGKLVDVSFGRPELSDLLE